MGKLGEDTDFATDTPMVVKKSKSLIFQIIKGYGFGDPTSTVLQTLKKEPLFSHNTNLISEYNNFF